MQKNQRSSMHWFFAKLILGPKSSEQSFPQKSLKSFLTLHATVASCKKSEMLHALTKYQKNLILGHLFQKNSIK